jgi:arylsulfatase
MMLINSYFLISLVTTFTHAFLPNYIVILADDLGYNDLGVSGSPTMSTPYLNEMAQEGLRFTQFYAAAPLCSPSRAAMLTGKLAIRTGSYSNLSFPEDNFFRVFYPSSIGSLPPTEILLSEYLQQSSFKYRTALIGKWHLGHNNETHSLPLHRGFDEAFFLPYSHEEGWPTNPEGWLWPPIPLYEGNQIIEQPVNLSSLTDRYTQRTLQFLDEVHISRQPFFLHLAFEQPHYPLFASPRFLNQTLRGLYGDAVAEMDYAIGQVLTKLRVTGLSQTTMVVFASDNGAWVNVSSGLPESPVIPFEGGCNAPLFGEKGSTWEGGFRVIGIFWWPGVITPGLSTSVASLLDLLPTFLTWSNISFPADDLDGFNLIPLLTGKNHTSPYLFFPYWRKNTLYALRYGPYKCHWWTRSGFGDDPPVYHSPCLLYQVEWDPTERFPLSVFDYADVFLILEREYTRLVAFTSRGPSQYLDQNFSLVPCCASQVNLEVILRALEEFGPGLAMWQSLGCVCVTYSNG